MAITTDTRSRRIDLTTVGDLNGAITALCDNMAINDYRLAAAFTYATELILVFQKSPH